MFLMKEINTKEYAYAFCNMLESIMKQFKNIGEWTWGNPAGQSGKLQTYELVADTDKKTWCTIIEYVNARTGEPNRKGILATFPCNSHQSLGGIMNTMIPYEFNRRCNTRAYYEKNNYEIRNYGKVTVGRSGIKRPEFFDYMNRHHPELVFLDEEDKPYIKVYEYSNELTKEEFARQTYNVTELLTEFKEKYR